MCPDAYSFAFDDQQSTFIVPMGGGWEIVMCPKGRSTNILRQLGSELSELANAGSLSELTVKRLMNVTYVDEDRSSGSSLKPMTTLTTLLIGLVSLAGQSLLL